MAISLVSALGYAATQLALGAGWIGWGKFLALTATFAALGAVNRALLGKQNALDTMSGITQNIKQPDSSRKIVYGKQRVGGTIVWFETKDSCRNNENSTFRNGLDTTRTAENEYLDMIIVLAAHEVESLEQIFLNDRKIWDVDDPTGDEWIGSNTDEFFGFTFYDGSQTSADLDAQHASQWGADDKLLGCAYIYCTMVHNPEIYANGIPNISCVIKGKKVYDPTKDGDSSVYDSNLGISSHDKDDPSTWEYTTNPALILLDYMRDSKFGLNENYSAFDENAIADSAAICNTPQFGKVESVGDFKVGRRYTIDLVAGSAFTMIGASANTSGITFVATGDGSTIGGSGTARQVFETYSCDGQIDTANPIKQNIENILTSMLGTMQYADGKYFINAYAWRNVQTDSIGVDQLVEPIQVSTKTSRKSLYNAVKGRFNSDLNNYQVSDYPPQISTAYEALDGERLFIDVDLPFTTHDIAAQRIAKLTMLKSRYQQSIQLVCNLSCMKYKVGDNIKLNYPRFGWTDKIFEINAFRLVPSAEKGLVVEISATENAQAAYNWTSSDQIDYTADNEVVIYDGSITAPTNLQATPQINTDNKPEIDLSWTASTAQGSVTYEITRTLLEGISTADSVSGVVSFTQVVLPVDFDCKYRFTIVAISQDGVRSTSASIDVYSPPEPVSQESIIIVDETVDLNNDQEVQDIVDAEAGDADETTIVQVDDAGNEVDSVVVVDTQASFEVETNKYTPVQIYLAAEPEVGNIDNINNWTITGSNFTATGTEPFTLNANNATAGDLVQSDFISTSPRINPFSADTLFRLEFDLTVTSGTLEILVQNRNGVNKRTKTYSTGGAKALNFDSFEHVTIILQPDSSFTGSISNLSLKRQPVYATTELYLSVPNAIENIEERKQFSQDVTWTYSVLENVETSGTGILFQKNTFNSYGGFKKFVLNLRRSRDQIGYSKAVVQVTASWGTNPTDSITQTFQLTAAIIP